MSLFDEAYCDGYGTMVCHCGGDLCVCGTDGEDCFGCEKCEATRDDIDGDLSGPLPEETHSQDRSGSE